MSGPLHDPTYRCRRRRHGALTVASWRNAEGLWSARIWALAAGQAFLVGEEDCSMSRADALINADPSGRWT